ncbi:hypothetical protein D3C79_921760 [compost metagenome]
MELELQPTTAQRQLLGGFVLRDLIGPPEQALLVYTRLSHRSVRPIEGLARAGMLLEHDLGIREIQADSIPPAKPWTLYVARPRITERTGDIHAVRPV